MKKPPKTEDDELVKKAELAAEREDPAALKATLKILGPKIIAECDALIADMTKAEKQSRSHNPELLRKIDKIKAQRARLNRELKEVLS